MINIRQATIDDIPLIMRFIDEHWRRGDTLAVNREFFEWSFVRNGIVTIIIGIDDELHIIYGINAYMPYTDDDYPDCYGTIWNAIKCSDDPLLGVHIGNYLEQNVNMRYYNGAGIRDAAVRFVKIKGGVVLNLDHYYRLNPVFKRTDYIIASIASLEMPGVSGSCKIFREIRTFEDFKSVISEEYLLEGVFRKDYKYIHHRYYSHPIYKYEFWEIRDENSTTSAVLITREETYNGSKALKIIDYYGPHQNFCCIGEPLDVLMKNRGYEYTDIYSYGVDTSVYNKGGMVQCVPESSNIIPNYFQPYECRNVEIYMEKSEFEGLVLFRGDGDQDRPCKGYDS